MLKRLSISNLAIIENAEISFSEGFSVLTGATGAGKSLVIDSLSLLLGARASSELIRTGEEKATIIGEFVTSSTRLASLLNQFEIPMLDGNLKVERIMSKNKSIVKVNEIAITLAELNQIAPYLADIHNQFDFQKILNEENYLNIIDGFASEMVAPYVSEYQDAYHHYHDCVHLLEDLKAKKKQIEDNQDFYSYQYKELKAADLKVGEEEELEDSLSLLRNYDKIYSLSKEASEIIHGDALDKLYDLKVVLSKMASFQHQYEESAAQIEDRYYELEDLFKSLKKSMDALDYDPSSLETMMQRQSDLASLKRKYRKSIEELIAFRDELEILLQQQESIDDDILKAEKEVQEAYDVMLKKGQGLTAVRERIAASIEKELSKNLDDLLVRNRFKIEFILQNPLQFNLSGMDQVDFLIETNIGEGLKPLAKIVSGGEASRIMLALKAVFVKAHKIPTVIFDEIDTGISGEAAQAVARKIKEISYARQVISITHLPQVASLSDHHILIEKEVKKDRTYVHIQELSLEEKIKEIAHLISGDKVTEKQLEYAREMVLSSVD